MALTALFVAGAIYSAIRAAAHASCYLLRLPPLPQKHK
jgi:hypothetical protein